MSTPPCTAYIHVPNVVLETDAPLDTPLGALTTVDFDLWTTLEGGMDDAGRHYGESRPVFLVTDLPGHGSRDELIQRANDRAHRLHDALLLATGTRLWTPLLSTTYIHWDNEVGITLRLRGPMDQEAILHGHTFSRIALTREAGPALEAALEQLERPAAQHPAVASARRDLEGTTRPECGERTAFVRCVAALEGMLVPRDGPRDAGITRTFGDRLGALACPPGGDPAASRAFAADLYRCRSLMLHGDDPTQVLERLRLDAARLDDVARTLLASTLDKVLRLCRDTADVDRLPEWLDEARGPEALRRLLSRLHPEAVRA